MDISKVKKRMIKKAERHQSFSEPDKRSSISAKEQRPGRHGYGLRIISKSNICTGEVCSVNNNFQSTIKEKVAGTTCRFIDGGKRAKVNGMIFKMKNYTRCSGAHL